jgi:ERF superfamily
MLAAKLHHSEGFTMKVYSAINAVQRALSITGIEKNRRNTQGSGYSFRGIDDVYNAIAPLLAEHGLVIIPRFLSRACDERQSKSGGALFYVTVEAEFDFVSAEDGSKHTARTFGEAMDSGDKATNKAMSAAYKYAAFQTFAIPTEGNPDADAETHNVEPQPTGMPAAVVADWLSAIDAALPDELPTLVRDGLASAEKAKDREAYVAIRAAGKKKEKAA